MPNFKISALLLLILFLCLPVGCGSDGDGGTVPNPPADLADVSLSATDSAPMAPIFVNGLPTKAAITSYEVIFLDADGLDLFSRILEVPLEGLPWFRAPFHPIFPNEGGPVQLVIAGGGVRSPVREIDLGALPAAPGSFARYVEVLREHIDQRAVLEGSSFAALAALDFAEVEPRLLPFKVAQSYVDDPNHPDCFARIADGTSTYLDATQKDLLDSIFGYAHIDSVVQADIDRLAGFQPTALAWFTDKSTTGDCVNMGPTVSTAPELSDAMQKAFEAKIATDPNGAPAQIMQAAGLAFSAAAFVPAFTPAASVLGAGVYAFQTSREYIANTYPSSFVSLDFALDRSELPEDEPGFAQWSDVNVIAQSKGWVADKAILNGAMQLMGAGLANSEKLAIQGSTGLRDAAMGGINMSLDTYLDGQPDGAVEFCSQRWRIDITDQPYSEGKAVIGRVSVDTQWREIRPIEIGTDIIRVKAVTEKFGFESVSADLPIETKAISVVATPDVITVQNPGEVVNITATIANADRVTLDWRTEAGSWNDGQGNETNEPGTRPLLTPTNEQAYPFFVVVESSSRQGLRASGLPARKDQVEIRHQTASIIVGPGGACVANGESEPFTATVQGLDNTAVTWSLEPVNVGGTAVGSVNQTGLYSAPSTGSGTALVVATSQEDPSVVGKVEVEVGACSCSWTLVVEGDGAWSGDFASHAFATQFSPYTMTIGYLDPIVEATGNIQIFESGPTSGNLGSWDCNFTWVTASRFWVAVNDADTPSTLQIFQNTGAQVQSVVSGTVLTAVGGEEFLRPFTLTIRSADILSGALCEE